MPFFAQRLDGPLGVLDLLVAALDAELDALERNRMALDAGDVHADGGEGFLMLADGLNVIFLPSAADPAARDHVLQPDLAGDPDVIALWGVEEFGKVEASLAAHFPRGRGVHGCDGGGSGEGGDGSLDEIAAADLHMQISAS